MIDTVTDVEPRRSPRRGATWRPWLGRLLLATGSGVLFYLSFAPRSLWWLAPLAFTGLGLALHGRRFRAGFGYGFVFGCTFFLLHLTWLQHFLGQGFGPWPWLGLSATLALYLGLAGGLGTVVARLPGAPVWMALVVIALETPRAWFPLGGFPWGRVGFSQPEGAYLALASIGGAPLVGFAVALTGFGLAWLLLRLWSASSAAQRTPRGLAVPVAATLLPVLAGLAVWPTVGTAPQRGSLTVAAVQGNAPDAGLDMFTDGAGLGANHLAETERLRRDIEAGRAPRPDLVVWPETAIGARPGANPRLDRMVGELGVPTVVGAVYQQPDGELENAAVAWDPDTGQGERYIKQQLVPFGETVPWRGLATMVTPFVNAVDERVQGTGDPAALSIAGTRVGLMICYEAAYDYPARDGIREGAELLLAPTNNAWYGRSEMSYQQLAMSRLRAVEHGRAVIVSATSGVSAIVQPDGSVSSSTELFTADSLVDEVPLRQQATLSDQLGAWTEYALVAAAVAAVGTGFALRWRARRGTAGTKENAAGDAVA
ncbi:apolipoprotein N-acyltransferase [Amycolatopsis cihanbeyliensis]|uniref:Apolipoprotein N-acyltransferase n=1 Tax=Amycolatopsis cihanbeyliensis TaxID=1128664 RepID=A0A542DC84_AMYCI|nr:apolipoprotein N-acyltransferase [Amycolatopsis cihanbeyliensis]TQJ00679.1 apolipoprotein N-acyltransferase [Amycolatopsis cihanbeyliensis]